MKNLMQGILVAWVLIMMSGCTGYGVTFQSAPSTTLSSCHPALVGNWRTIEGERNAPASSTREFLSVSADCSKIITVTIKQELGKKEIKIDNLKDGKDYQIQFSIGDNLDYVVVTPKETSFEISPDIKLASGKIIYQINKGKDGVILRSIDLDKTAHLVLQRKISGQLHFDRDNPDSMKASNIYVRGDAKQTAEYLSTLDLYADDRILLIPATRKELKAIQKAIRSLGQDDKYK